MAETKNDRESWRPFDLDQSAMAIAGLFDSIDDVVFWIKDLEGIYRVVNRNFLLKFGFDSESDVLGKTDFDISPHYIATQFRMDDEKVLSGKAVRGRIELVGRFDHSTEWCETNKVPLRVSGQMVGTAGMTKRLPDGLATAGIEGNEALAIVVDYCRTHLDCLPRNREMAELAGLSQRVFERKFRSNFQSSPQRYMRKLRVRMSCYALVNSSCTLAEVAAAHGFCDQSHFGREFRKETGLSPHEYRERFRSRKKK